MDNIERDENGRWTPGQSGNPSGRPRRESLTSVLRELADECPPGDKRTRSELLANKIFEIALGGDIVAIKAIYERIDGTPRQTIQTEDGPLEIRINHLVDGI